VTNAVPSSRTVTPLTALAAQQKVLAPLTVEMVRAVQARDYDEVESVCREMIRKAPFLNAGYYNLACILAVRGRTEQAFAELERAVGKGGLDVRHMAADPDLVSLRGDSRFAELLQIAAAVRPSWLSFQASPAVPGSNQTVTVEETNVFLHPQWGLPVARYHLPSNAPAGAAVTTLSGPVGDLLRKWYAEGTAAGHAGDLYDNRDANHSDLTRSRFPQLTWIEYGACARDAGVHYGLAANILHDGVVIGNASVAQTAGPFWRSMTRLAYANQNSATLLYVHYASNKIYFYPSHADHTAGHNGRREGSPTGGYGDVFPANTPYVITSQGSSGSDQPFLSAIACTMAAFRPETKRCLIEKGILAPTLQMIFRSSSRLLAGPEDYFRGIAHPSVFPAAMLCESKMVETAHAMRPSDVPPLVQLRVLEEDPAVNGRDYFDLPDRTEDVFTTPCAVARVFRSVARQRRMIVSAATSRDANGRALSYRWAVLRGDPAKVAIAPLNASTSLVQIVVDWQPRRPVAADSAIESSRIDVGAFAFNGVHWSAPAFVTWLTLDNEEREYDAAGRVRRVTYKGAAEAGNYVDPQIALARSWTDAYRYAEDGRPDGWTRRRPDGTESVFDADGRRVVGDPAAGGWRERVVYGAVQRSAGAVPILVETNAPAAAAGAGVPAEGGEGSEPGA
jgi:hypothetical protein